MKHLLLGTRKGLIIYQKENDQWNYVATHFLGIPVSLAHVDVENRIWWAFLDHGHWGVKVHRSFNEGKDWEEMEAPVYPEGAVIKEDQPASLKYIWAAENWGNKLLLGTDPGGLFESDDQGMSFQLNKALWNHPSRSEWFGGGRDNPGIHSICIDPRDQNHLYIAISCAGVFETTDGGKTWNPKNKGLKADFLPDPDAEVGQDPHLLVMSPSNPDVMWQQNHCGIFRTTDGGSNWIDISEKEGPANFGFAIQVHPQDQNRAWVVPGISDGVRVAYDQKLQVCRTDDGGKTWKSFSQGLPSDNSFDIVYRHALDFKEGDLVFGTTTGNLFVSSDLGESWQVISHHLPMIYSVHLV